MRPTRPHVLAAAAALVVGFSPAAARAHDLKAVVTVTATEVKVEAGYDDTPADGGRATMTAADGREVAAGVLDATGRWAAAVPPPGTYTVVVNDAGHRDRVTFTIPEPAATEPAPADVTYTNWRLGKFLGVVIGLGAILGGTVLYTLLRRRRGSRPGGGMLS